MTLPAYPIDLPCPTAAPLTWAERRIGADESGPLDFRSTERNLRGTQQVSFVFSALQAESFRDWYEALEDGGTWFVAQWSSTRPGTFKRRFAGPVQWQFVPGGIWRVRANLEIEEVRPPPPPVPAPAPDPGPGPSDVLFFTDFETLGTGFQMFDDIPAISSNPLFQWASGSVGANFDIVDFGAHAHVMQIEAGKSATTSNLPIPDISAGPGAVYTLEGVISASGETGNVFLTLVDNVTVFSHCQFRVSAATARLLEAVGFTEDLHTWSPSLTLPQTFEAVLTITPTGCDCVVTAGAQTANLSRSASFPVNPDAVFVGNLSTQMAHCISLKIQGTAAA